MPHKGIRLSKTALFALGLSLLAACQKNASDGLLGNLVKSGDPNVNQTIGDNKNSFAVLGSQAFQNEVQSSQIKLAVNADGAKVLDTYAQPVSSQSIAAAGSSDTASAANAKANSLVVGIPIGLLGERQVFGGVITKLSDGNSTNLGDLKLTDIEPLGVKTIVAKTGTNQYSLALLGCASKCTEASEEGPLLAFPISGVDQTNNLVMVDFSTIGASLNLVALLDPDGSYTKLKTKSSKTVAVDYSTSTLVFDVEATMVPVDSKSTDTNVPETVFTTRWYIKLDSAFNPAFTPRDATTGVGFFMTGRTATPKLQRWTLPTTFNSALPAPVHYYIKNVPKEYQAAFASCFDEWNQHFVELVGKKIFSYEFVDPTSALNDELVTGDVRYNIVEWDLVNQASYGGLGPSVANQFTGEIFSANVLIQGPTVVKLYTDWFKTGQQAQALLAQGEDQQAEKLLHAAKIAENRTLDSLKAPQLSLTVGAGLQFRVTSQVPGYEDPSVERNDFEELPPNMDYATYMAGYFHDMLTHELGHNLGLRHNFRGSLYGAATASDGHVSASVMEYLGRNYREYDHVGDYDLMAIKYGYLGVEPTVRNMFCTDEDQPSAHNNYSGSAECNSSDATDDPFGYFENRLSRATLLLAGTSGAAPTWTVPEMDSELTSFFTGMGLYASTADETSGTWTNFFGKSGRPLVAQGTASVKAYVLGRIKAHLCDPTLLAAGDSKSSADAKAAVQANVAAFQAKAAKVLTALKAYTADDLKCSAE